MCKKDSLWISICVIFTFSSTVKAQFPIDAEAQSYLDAVSLNGKSLVSFDVLYRTEEVTLLGPHVSIESFYRYRFDDDGKRALFLARRKYGGIENGKAVRKSMAYGILFQDGELAYSKFDGVIKNFQGTMHVALGRYGQVPNMRMVGLSPFPQSFAMTKSFTEDVKLLALGQKATPVADGKIQLQRSIPFSADRNLLHVETRVFSPDTLLPGLTTMAGERVLNGQRKRQVMLREACQWEEHESVYVPSNVEQSRYKSSRPEKEKEPESSEKITDTVFHWFSVNKTMDDKHFDPSIIEALPKAMKLLDPKLAKATSLVSP